MGNWEEVRQDFRDIKEIGSLARGRSVLKVAQLWLQ